MDQPFQTDQEKKWELGGEIITKGFEHPSLAEVKKTWDAVRVALAEVRVSSANLKKVGVGRTEDPTLILTRLVPALREHAETVAFVAKQMEERLKGA